MPGWPGRTATHCVQKTNTPSASGLSTLSSQQVAAAGSTSTSASMFTRPLSTDGLVLTHALETRRVNRLRDDANLRGKLEGCEALGAEPTHSDLEFVARLRPAKSNGRRHNLSGKRMRLAEHDDISDVLHLEENAFNFSGIHLAAADVDHVARAPQKADPFPVGFHEVSGVEEPVCVERARRVEVPQHRGTRTNPETLAHHLAVEIFATDSHPQRIRFARLRAKDAELRQAVRLEESCLWKCSTGALQRARRHRLSAVRDQAE